MRGARARVWFGARLAAFAALGAAVTASALVTQVGTLSAVPHWLFSVASFLVVVAGIYVGGFRGARRSYARRRPRVLGYLMLGFAFAAATRGLYRPTSLPALEIAVALDDLDVPRLARAEVVRGASERADLRRGGSGVAPRAIRGRL